MPRRTIIAILDNHTAASRARFHDPECGPVSREVSRVIAALRPHAPLITVLRSRDDVAALRSQTRGSGRSVSFICSGSELDVEDDRPEARGILAANLAVLDLFPRSPKLLVCYAFQAVAHAALGWRARRLPQRMRGIHAILRPGQADADVFLNHVYYLDARECPADARVLATLRQAPHVCQAYACDRFCALGVQFHPERFAQTRDLLMRFATSSCRRSQRPE